jgi:hypothetical protein
VISPLVSCGQTQISCIYSNGAVEADPDIAGIGVGLTIIIPPLTIVLAGNLWLNVCQALFSFAITSMITLLAILFGYITYSLAMS